MNIVDAVMLGALAVFAWTGWRQGFVAGLLSFTGFLAGGVAGAFLVPPVVANLDVSGLLRAAVVAFGVLGCAVLGQALTSMLGRYLRRRITWEPARLADNIGGAALNVLALAVVSWIVASAVATMPDSALSRQIRSSGVMVGLDALVPDAARDLFTGLRDLVGTSDVPRVFAGFAEIAGPEVEAPDATLPKDPEVRAALGSLVQVTGPAPACGTEVTGSGFVYAPERVLTNAHVVAGVTEPEVRLAFTRELLPARVVAFDDRLDIAVLLVPGLKAPALGFRGDGDRDDGAVVAGFPGGGKLSTAPARIRAVIEARGEDIYGRAGVLREVYSFRGTVLPGNSGGPLIAPDGRAYGMVFASGIDDPTTGYALTARQLAGVAEQGRTSSTAVPQGTCRVRD
ncbi:MAG: MarP family serine protease [Candidatus Nanopelagicales bacterium]